MMPATCPCGQRLQTSEEAAETHLTCPDCGWSLIVPGREDPASGPGSGAALSPGRPTIVPDPGAGPAATTWIPRLGAAAATLGLVAATAHGASCSAWGAAIAGLGLTLAGAGLLIAYLRGHTAGIVLTSGLYCATIAALALTATPADTPGPAAGSVPLGPRPIPVGRHLRRDDVQVRIIAAEVARPRVRELYFSEPAQWKKPGLLLTLEIRNVGTRRRVAYEPRRCHVVDDLGNTYQEVDMGTDSLADRSLGDRRLDPGQSLREVLFFDPPMDRITYLELVLPGATLGQVDPFRLRIPADVIRR